MKRLAVSLLLISAMGACRSSNTGDDDGDGGPPDGSISDDVPIQDIQSDDMPVDTPVTVRGVVVIAIDAYGGRTGAVHVMEPDGGPFSGVVVNSLPSQSAGLVVGDLIDIEGGFKDEFACTGDICGGAVDDTGRTITQITGTTLVLTKVGDGTVPAAEVLNPWDLAADDAEAEKWEGVLVQFNEVAVNSAPRGVSSSDPLLMEMAITGPYNVSSALTELTAASGDCFASISGIGDYFFTYKILPRSAADLVTGGTACPAAEEGDTACADTSDNDYDGFADCADFSCQQTVASCTTTTTVSAIRTADPLPLNTSVELQGVYITGMAFNRKNFWVSDSLTGAANEGIYVFRGFSSATALPSEYVVGARVDVVATVTEYKGLLELSSDPDTGVTFVAAPGSLPTAVTGQTLATLADATSGEPYEGALVTVNNLEITAVDLTNFQFTVTDGVNSIAVDDEIFRYGGPDNTWPPLVGECFSSITGIMHVDTGPSAPNPGPRILLPRSGDVQTTACP